MPFLKNSWYAAGWKHELTDAPIARTMLNEPVVIFRNKDGAPVALHDTCPHRFAPLSRGKIKDGIVACGYHGLEFDGAGTCIRNPHSNGAIPTSLNVRAFPMAERYGMLWIWMGNADRADVALIPHFEVLDDPSFSWVHGVLPVDANYELVIDNLLDLTHVEYLHPFLASPGSNERTNFSAAQDGNDVSAHYVSYDEPITSLFALLWQGTATRAELHADMRWKAPSNLFLETSMSSPNEDPNSSARVPTAHFLTPETEDRTHYFWAAGRNRHHENEEIGGMLRFGVQHAFENEDEPMIRAVRSRMHSNDLFAHKPALLPIDEAAVRARRVIAKLLKEESTAVSQAA